jgi:DNA-directed RNA polymerase II subunit RPB2
MASNIVLVFHKKAPSKYSWVSEIRSMAENMNKAPQQFCVRLMSKVKSGFQGQTIQSAVPQIREDIPVGILLRALNVIGDKQIQDLMIYDQSDTDMIDMLRASLEEAAIIRTRDDALDYIAKRGGH